ncbi:restriction endonuclease subunit S [Cytobacillus firmus]|uniref:restriction endonuclease subunit S n=1 Tax=Cytobacillus firmus TaxID=1399 RepID=UPI002187ABDC|nr:restriction endonuclease subunit S [Cytobacillus firmus]URM31592.1 restriction endonuclease subunit S [Cytobacillus firmus]
MKYNIKTLGDCVELVIDYRGKTPKKLGGDWSEVKDGYRALSAKNIKEQKLVNKDSIRYLSEELYRKWMKEEVIKGDLLLTSEGPLGESLLWDSDEKIVLSQRLFAIRPKKEVLYPKFLAAFAQSSFFRYELEARATGTTVLGIRQPELLKTKLILPPMEVQKFIGDLHYNINSKLRANEEIIDQLESIAQSLFENWFINFEFPNEEGKQYKSSEGDMVDSELGKIPKGWKIWSLNELVDNISQSIKKKEKKQAIFLNTSDILEGEFLHSNYSDTSQMPGQAKKLIQKDDILYSEIRPANKRFAYVDFDAKDYVVSTKLMVLRTKQEIFSSKCLYLFLKNIKTIEQLQRAAESRSGTFPQITFKEISLFKFALPEKGFFDGNYKILEHLVDLQLNLIRENQVFRSLRNTLIPKLLSGEIQIPLEKEEILNV